MANRSYLYSSNFVPSPNANGAHRRMTGISEWRNDVPVAFKILLSSNARKCRSSIWKVPEEIAIIGDYDPGLDRLLRFLDRIPVPDVVLLKEEARRFLTDAANKNEYFVLECGEIFEMDDAPLAEQNERLLAIIRHIESVEESALAKLVTNPPSATKAGGWFSRTLGHKSMEPKKNSSVDAVNSLGLGNWSNVLYFDLRQP